MTNKIIIIILLLLFITTGESQMLKENFYNFPSGTKISKIDYDKIKGFTAIDSKGEILFTIFPFDNGPDYESEGLIRIIDNNKIGFADLMGNIIIEPQFSAALPFKSDFAGVCKGCNIIKEHEHNSWVNGKWGFIDRKGELVIDYKFDRILSGFENGIATVKAESKIINIDKSGSAVLPKNYEAWTALFAEEINLITKIIGDNNYNCFIYADDEQRDAPPTNLPFVNYRITIKSFPADNKLIDITLIPWQNISFKLNENIIESPLAFQKVVTVNEYSIIYAPEINSSISQNDKEFINDLLNHIKNFSVSKNSNSIELNFPESLQIINQKNFNNYVELEVAEPGSRLPNFDEWGNMVENKMLHLIITPDIGIIKEYWIQPNKVNIDTYYTSVEDSLLVIFNSAISESLASPNNRNKIFEKYSLRLRKVFNAANSYVNHLFGLYESRLKNWLFVEEENKSKYSDPFPDYIPKFDEDTMLDFMPSLSDELNNLPAASEENLPRLIQLFKSYKLKSITDKGEWVDGNQILGAKEREYRPSESELILSEIGERIRLTANTISYEDFKKFSNLLGHPPLSYKKFTFTHVDVMGSGRFFYVDNILEIKIDF